jgi:hypothetical protein
MSSASVDTIWKSILEEIRQESPILHVLLDKNVRPYVVNSTLYLETKNSWSLQKLSQTRFRSKLDDVVRKHFNTSYSIEFVLASTTAPREDPTAGSTDEERATSLLSTPEIQNHGEVTNSSNPATITDTIRALLTHTGEEGVILVLESLIEHIKSSSTDTELAPVNQSVLTKTNIIEHDNLVFRSYSEICVYNRPYRD